MKKLSIVLILWVLLAATSIASAENTVDSRFAAARNERMHGDVKKAIAELQAIANEAPENYLVQYNLGLALIQSGRHDEAIGVLTNAANLRDKQDAPDVTIYNTLGWELMQTGKASEAIVQFEKGRALEGRLTPDSRSRLLNNYGLALMQVGRYDDAQQALKQASTDFGNSNAARNLELAQALKENAGRWTVVFGGDKTLAEAQDQLKKAEKTGIENATIVNRANSFRSVATFDSHTAALDALNKAKTFQGDAYVVLSGTWCQDASVSTDTACNQVVR